MYVNTCMHINVYMYIKVHMCMCMCRETLSLICMYVHTHKHIYIYIYICVCVCVYTNIYTWTFRAFLVVQTVKNLPAVQETWVHSLGWEDPLEKGMATYSSLGFPDSSVGKESICQAGDPGSIPEPWRSSGEGISYSIFGVPWWLRW